MALPDTTNTTSNATETLYGLVKRLRASVTRATVQESLLKHPDFPSLLSLSEVLTDWQIDNTALQLNTTEQLRELPLPCIAHLRKNNGWYVLVTDLQGDTITFTDSANGRTTESLTDFERKWSGVVLLAETNEQSGEINYGLHRKQEILDELRAPFLLAGAILLFLFAILSVAKDLAFTDWLLLLTKSTGLTLSGLLVAKQLGSKNALTDRLCRINSKTNCDDVLNSPAAKLWGWLSWADVGLLYFAGGLLTVLLIGIQLNVLPLLRGLALLAVPFTLFSVYYQGVVLKQWCPLCLGVQGILLIEGILAARQLTPLPDFVMPYVFILIAFLMPTLAWAFVKPLLTNLLKSRREHDELMRLKRDPDLFRALLMQQPQMTPIPADLHPIMLGNPDAEHTITLVTNPYCGPCAKMHKELEQLLERNSTVRAAIIFAFNSADEAAMNVAVHTMALAQQGNTSNALIDWYEQPEKNFGAWVKKYPLVSDSMDWITVINKHNDWCRSADIRATPTVYVVGYELSEQYRVSSLRWLINYLPAPTSTMDLAKS